jgi:hypothetical protein
MSPPSGQTSTQTSTEPRIKEHTVSPLQQSLLISGSIFAVVMITQYGRRAYTLHALIRPLLMCAGFGYFYVKGAPTSTADVVVYAVGAGIGVVFGVVSYLLTRVEREPSGAVKTVTGYGFVGVWLLAVAVRITFIALSEHNATFRRHLGQFMVGHGIIEDAIAPFFVLMALAMVISRIALVAAKARRLPAVQAPAPQVLTNVAA